MQLQLAVTRPGSAEPEPVTIDFDALEEKHRILAVGYCGVEPMSDLVSNGWNREAAKALVYVAIQQATGGQAGFEFEDFDLDWGALGFELDPDPEIEGTLPMVDA